MSNLGGWGDRQTLKCTINYYLFIIYYLLEIICYRKSLVAVQIFNYLFIALRFISIYFEISKKTFHKIDNQIFR